MNRLRQFRPRSKLSSMRASLATAGRDRVRIPRPGDPPVPMLENALADVAILRRRYAALQRLSESAVTVLAWVRSAR